MSPLPALDDAPDEIKLAVDLIYLLESNQVDPRTALLALDYVKRDLESKLKEDK
ncbi:pleiotropic regulatory protein RsmS [Vibrio metschnikovii]|uniref:pleiotropic regulatory protein RsmS n=1 Tax=Vibrio metschnikovii TaxID=28172 RepID=UPI001648F483|nr:pleiotropic regulatory protein RsmS [Vibrio metschnikovii]EKO3563728.1 pleiotropic regulatory protein RsmS [Vibrio metschnikovii]EKO3598025.1 pleiotropic regulatory protein RsmS [Vibrio metschnikovii]EKO3660851.1 pleiotropic regulatory protein RsmS [Vibrio metschnikovii]EKO3768477.1 pleiotropic regulatory protein RsmS [Vibrio metschnikovii]EKO3790964.1 pleiotropic regulatory protein RsmS [Vibrio metschnikovii]